MASNQKACHTPAASNLNHFPIHGKTDIPTVILGRRQRLHIRCYFRAGDQDRVIIRVAGKSGAGSLEILYRIVGLQEPAQSQQSVVMLARSQPIPLALQGTVPDGMSSSIPGFEKYRFMCYFRLCDVSLATYMHTYMHT
jgi:hypothetical protein